MACKHTHTHKCEQTCAYKCAHTETKITHTHSYTNVYTVTQTYTQKCAHTEKCTHTQMCTQSHKKCAYTHANVHPPSQKQIHTHSHIYKYA